jgi:multidrug efflux pump
MMFTARRSTTVSASWWHWCVRRRWLVIGITLLLFALAIAGMGKVQKQFFPNSTRLELNVELRLPEGASLTAIDAEAKRLEEWLDKDKARFGQHDHYIAYVGSGSPRYLPFASTSNCPPPTSASWSS